MKKTKWNIPDLLDFEFFLHRDLAVSQKSGDAKLVERDRKLYQQKLGQEVGDVKNEQSLVWHWLQAVKKMYEKEPSQESLPGTVWKELSGYARWLFFAGGLFAGIAAVLPYLMYTGERPLNVTGYFALFVLLQLFFVVLQLTLLGIRRLRRNKNPTSMLGAVAERLLLFLLQKLYPVLERKYSPATRDTCERLRKRLSRASEEKLLFLWGLFTLMQLAGIGFNCGVISATLSKVVFTDTAFGWQSTLQVNEQLLANIVSWIALPWSWLFPDQFSYPGIEAIRGSRIILKDGVHGLTTPNLVSWWPFLCCSVFFYGLVPRLGMLLWGWTAQKRCLEHCPQINRPEVRRLLQRMKTPAVVTSGEKKTAVSLKSGAAVPEKKEPAELEQERHEPTTGSAVLLLIPDELQEQDCTDHLLEALQLDLSRTEITLLVFGSLEKSDEEVLEETRALIRRKAVAELIMVQEGWQPPIEETLSWLKDVREAVGQDLSITIALLGKPRGGKSLTPAERSQVDIWSMKTAPLHDGNLCITSLLP